MEVITELLTDCCVLKSDYFNDLRGCLVKTYSQDEYKKIGLNIEIREEFYSISHRNVLRGMHFQLPPHSHEKLVYCARGSVLDVLIDLRAGINYGRIASTILSEDNGHIIYIPKGIAHGFISLDANSMMMYKTSSIYQPKYDSGIRWDSFDFNWGLKNPLVSERDLKHISLRDFKTPF